MFAKNRSVGAKCSICKEMYVLYLDEDRDQSVCPKCMDEAKDRKHRLNNSNWDKFEAKFYETD